MVETPRITLAQLSDYLTASPGRRRSIVEDMKDPKPYMVSVYNEASDLLARRCYAPVDGGSSVLERGLTALADRAASPTISDQQRQNARLSREAVEAAVRLLDGERTLRLTGREVVPLAQGGAPLLVEGVQVNVRPEVIVRERDGRNRPALGAVKFYFPKTKKLGADRAAYMGAILHWFCEHGFPEDDADCRLCLVADVVTGTIHPAPKATKRRRDDIRGACDEIRVRWLGG